MPNEDVTDIACRYCGGGFGFGDRAVETTVTLDKGLVRKVYAHRDCSEALAKKKEMKKEESHGS